MNSTQIKLPYYAVIFTSSISKQDEDYNKVSRRMIELANDQSGFIGFESARNEIGISVSYWKDLESIKKWKENIEHIEAQRRGKEEWYSEYRIRIAKVEKEYHYSNSTNKTVEK